MKDNLSSHVLYQGKMIPKAHFRAFVYGKKDDEKKLAKSWEEYEELVASGIWFSSKPEKKEKRKKKDD